MNKQVNDFDVEKLAKQLEFVGAGYYFITVGQASGHYCSPNIAYDKIAGVKPSKCANRDLVADLYDALAPKGIKLMVYMPSEGPHPSPECEKIGWEWGYDGPKGNMYDSQGKLFPRKAKRLAEFQNNWEAVITEWSLRWGNKICGWWVDSCYFADEMYNHSEKPNFESFKAALQAGNSQSIVAFNPGVLTPITTGSAIEDYTAGEIDTALPVASKNIPMERWINGKQLHILSYLGSWWGQGAPLFFDNFVVAYTKYINDLEGVITWEVPINKNETIIDEFVNQLEKLKQIRK